MKGRGAIDMGSGSVGIKQPPVRV